MGQWPDLAAASAEVVVDDFCSWKIDHFPSRRLDPFAPVNVFPVEEAFIQQTDLLEGIPTHQHRCAGDLIHYSLLFIPTRGHLFNL